MNKSNKAWLVLFALLVVGVSQPSLAFIVYDPSNWAQNALTAKNSLKSLINQVTQIQNQLKQLQLESQNSKALDQYQWQTISDLITKLDQATQQGNALSYAMGDVGERFKKSYPDYVNSDSTNPLYQEEYHHWSATTLDTLKSALQALHVSGAHFQEEESLLSKLRGQGQAATGRLQALQVSTALAAENVNQLQELKRLIAVEANAQNAFMANDVSKRSFEEHQLELLSQPIKTAFPPYQNTRGLGLITNR